MLWYGGGFEAEVVLTDRRPLPAAARRFRSQLQSPEFDVAFQVSAMVGYMLSPEQAVTFGFAAWVPGLDDGVGSLRRPAARSDPNYDLLVYGGFVAGYKWGWGT